MTFVCERCEDTHSVYNEHSGRSQMCVRCPTPCQKCRQGGYGAYCEKTPCACDCHAPSGPRRLQFTVHFDGAEVDAIESAAAKASCPRNESRWARAVLLSAASDPQSAVVRAARLLRDARGKSAKAEATRELAEALARLDA